MLDDDLEVVIGIIVASLFTGPFEDDAVRIALFFVIGIGVGAGVGLGRKRYIYMNIQINTTRRSVQGRI